MICCFGFVVDPDGSMVLVMVLVNTVFLIILVNCFYVKLLRITNSL